MRLVAPIALPRRGWLALACGESPNGAAAWRRQFPATVRDNVLRAVSGIPGQPAYLELGGTIQPDGTALLNANGLTANPTYTIGRLSPGSPYGFQVRAQFNDQRGTGTRTGQDRPCTLSFTRE